MSQLIQQKKVLTFEEICPIWSQRISQNDMITAQDASDLTTSKYCIVGEAHGFDSDYRHSCIECKNFSSFTNSMGLCGVLCDGEHEEFEQRKEAFVKHFNEVHIK